MSKQDIFDYKELEDSLRDSLESEFNYHMVLGDYNRAHEILLNLMEYKLIPSDDPRCSPKTKIFIGVDVGNGDNWGRLDYRRKNGVNFMPKYLLCDLAISTGFDVTVLEHWGKRVEGNYSGDIKVESYNLRVRMSLVNDKKNVSDTVEKIAKLIEQINPTTKANVELMKEEALTGVVRIYSLDVIGNILAKYRNLGYVTVKMGGNGEMKATVFAKYEAMYNSWIDIKEFDSKVAERVQYCVSRDVSVKNKFNASEALSIQASMCGQSKQKDEDAKKLRAKVADEARKAKEKREKAEQEKKNAAELKKAKKLAKTSNKITTKI